MIPPSGIAPRLGETLPPRIAWLLHRPPLLPSFPSPSPLPAASLCTAEAAPSNSRNQAPQPMRRGKCRMSPTQP
ncbi:uncharacterized protein K441DRAFT_653745 [Cenococcum geophilum 1.58]|uniref:uncharacterized protein n=1 Tax=Cenococcum geophilum 1.58 TaxID=794803 RepID=UPI00359008BA|nr:hypothetical protein K441DRAFT_653745 [Cenococcum geophilum 1.58]